MSGIFSIKVSGDAICPGCFNTVTLKSVKKDDTGECPHCPVEYKVMSTSPIRLQVNNQRTFGQAFGEEEFA